MRNAIGGGLAWLCIGFVVAILSMLSRVIIVATATVLLTNIERRSLA
jgi:hypothetical protein